MTLEVLLSCMHQQDTSLVQQSHLTGNVLLVNQCDREGYMEMPTPGGQARMISTTQRGLTRSRNMAIENAVGDVCMLSDNDEVFVEGYAEKILSAYESLPQADVIVFRLENIPTSLGEKVRRLRFPLTMKVSSWQISFRRSSLLRTGVRFDVHLGAGSGNGAEEELKFLLDCQGAGLKIYYVPVAIAAMAETESTWFHGFDQRFFENRGTTTRYILGPLLAGVYGIYYVVRKRGMYQKDISPRQALKATFRGIRENRIGKQVAEEKKQEKGKGTTEA